MSWKTWTGTATFWETLSKRSLLVFLAGVFCLFASLGFILDCRTPQQTTAGELAMGILVRACIAVGWAFFGTHRMFKSMILLAGVQVSFIWFLHQTYGNAPKLALNSAALGNKLTLDSAGAMVLVISGYVMFLLFFQWEGKRFFAAHTEITLATEIHQSLVPEQAFQTSAFQFFGVSFPSGAVGGDLVDVVVRDDTWLGYVADVSGHGVPAGVLMSMVKSAVHMRLACREHQAALLDDLNDVLKPLLKPNMFVTLAYAAWKGGPDLEIASAGHVPLLHYHASTREVNELMPADLPLGIVAGKQFASSKLPLESGDLLAIITDGITETFDASENEFGMEGVKQVLCATGTKDLRYISTEIRTRALVYGEQRDDQTILLIRRLR
jgi:hypothetical protein